MQGCLYWKKHYEIDTHTHTHDAALLGPWLINCWQYGLWAAVCPQVLYSQSFILRVPGRVVCVYVQYMYVWVCIRAGDDVTVVPGYVLFKFKQAEGGGDGGELEECQTLDWISMNSKEADRGDRGKERGGRGGDLEREERETISANEEKTDVYISCSRRCYLDRPL